MRFITNQVGNSKSLPIPVLWFFVNTQTTLFFPSRQKIPQGCKASLYIPCFVLSDFTSHRVTSSPTKISAPIYRRCFFFPHEVASSFQGVDAFHLNDSTPIHSVSNVCACIALAAADDVRATGMSPQLRSPGFRWSRFLFLHGSWFVFLF